MPAKPAPTRRERARNARPRPGSRGFWPRLGGLPSFLRPTSKAWIHWNRAAVEFLHGVRAVLDECIEEIERSARQRAAGRLKRIEVG